MSPVKTSIKCQHHYQFKNVMSKLMMVSHLVSRSGLEFVSLKVTLINYQLIYIKAHRKYHLFVRLTYDFVQLTINVVKLTIVTVQSIPS